MNFLKSWPTITKNSMCDMCYGIYPNCPVCGDDDYDDLEDDDFIDDEE